MPKHLKGTAEDIIATIFAVILLIVFIIAAINSYSSYLKSLANAEQLNLAINIAEKIYLDSQGIINTGQNLSIGKNVKVILLNLEEKKNYTYGDSQQNASSVFSSSLAVLIYNSSENKYTQGRLEVYVSR